MPPRPRIQEHTTHRLWVLTGAVSSLVLHVAEDGLLYSPHWGAALDAEQAASLLTYPGPRERSFEDSRDGVLALAPSGGARFHHAGLQVRFADGGRDLDLAFEGSEERTSPDGSAELVLRFVDRHHPLRAAAHFTVLPGCDVIERHLVLHHTGAAGDAPIEVVRADSATWVLPPLPGYRLSQVRGQWAAETQLHRGELAYGQTVLGSRRGVSGHHANPWAMIDDGTADEDHGEVYGCALAWSGSWQLTAERTPGERVALSAGMGHPPAAVRTLAPGDSLTTPTSAGLWTDGGFGAASRAWHAYVRTHVVPHPTELRPVLYNSWEATGFAISLDGQRALAERAAKLGVELFVMDDGWFGARTHDAAGLGDWTPNPERFPDGLSSLADHVHRLGMAFGLWVEPEMVNPDSDLYREHPEWVLHAQGRPPTEMRHQLVLDLSRPEVAAWVHATIDGLLTAHAIDFLKWDMNRPFTEVPSDEVWTGYVHNLYGVLDRLRRDHPGVRIENCSSGGGRVDLGMLARTDQTWISDNTDAVDRLRIQHGFGQLYPAQLMAAWVTDSPNPFTGRVTPLDYRFHVAMAGVLGIGADLAAWSDAELDHAARLVAEYKAVRPLVQHGVAYRLRPPAPGLHAVQYLAQDGAACAVLVHRAEQRFGRADPALPLRDLDPAGRYRDIATGTVHHGAVLLARGLPLRLPAGDRASALFHLHRED
jgi:alpha-galactosidase